MRRVLIDPPRRYRCGKDGWVTLSDVAHFYPEVGEAIVFPGDHIFSFCMQRESWGMRVVNRLNDRAASGEWSCVLAGESKAKTHLMLIAPGARSRFETYCRVDGIEVFRNYAQDGPALPLQAAVAGVRDQLVNLRIDEQVTIYLPGAAEIDVTRKDWGYYGSSSFGWRLPKFGLQVIELVDTHQGCSIAFVENGRQSEFAEEMRRAGYQFTEWSAT